MIYLALRYHTLSCALLCFRHAFVVVVCVVPGKELLSLGMYPFILRRVWVSRVLFFCFDTSERGFRCWVVAGSTAGREGVLDVV